MQRTDQTRCNVANRIEMLVKSTGWHEHDKTVEIRIRKIKIGIFIPFI